MGGKDPRGGGTRRAPASDGGVCDAQRIRSPSSPMVAFILAAGYGTRLRPLTHTTPKALVEVGGVTMLERVARRCIDAGAEQIVVNVSHLAEAVIEFLDERGGFGVPFIVSEEPEEPLETGGGIKKAALHFPEGADVLVHNVDILTNIDLRALVREHAISVDEPLVTLAVARAETDRYLLFDDSGLAGYAYGGEEKLMREVGGNLQRLDFCGVQVLSAKMVDLVRDEPAEAFSVMDLYLRLAKEAAPIFPFSSPDHRCLDMGTHERLAEAEVLVGEMRSG
jgi:N-acetyl-alpha-D-muramate 1-phosphate uridylyltransferase